MRNLKQVIFLGKLNNLELRGADIGNAYLEAPTEEKLYIVSGPEFEVTYLLSQKHYIIESHETVHEQDDIIYKIQKIMVPGNLWKYN